MNVQPNGSCQSYLTRIRQRLQGLGADQMVLQPFMARSHYLQNFDFQPYARRPEPDYSPATWEHHYWLFELYKHEYGFFLPTAELMDRLVGFLQAEIGPAGRVLDAGSGSGFLSKELCRRGIDTFAVDRCAYEDQKVQRQFGYPMITVYQRDAMGDAVNHVSRQFGAVLLVWPPYDKSFAFDIAKAMHPGQLLIFEGEGAGGCAGDDKFFEYVSDGEQWLALKELSDQLDAVHVTFAPQHDHWFIWRKVQQ